MEVNIYILSRTSKLREFIKSCSMSYWIPFSEIIISIIDNILGYNNMIKFNLSILLNYYITFK
jgi:hypothetical protein